jgi:hypothetical protein
VVEVSLNLSWLFIGVGINWCFACCRDGKTIQSSSEYSSSFDGRLAQLSIRGFTEAKAGLYKCLADSTYGEAQSSATVKFEMTGRSFVVYTLG